MDESFQRFYNTLDKQRFKYFVKDGEYIVYGTDIEMLPQEIRGKGKTVKLENIEPIVRELLTTHRIAVEEYSGYKLVRSGTPTNYDGFTDICISDSIQPTICAVSLIKQLDDSELTKYVEFAFLEDGKIKKTVFPDDDLLSRTYSMCSRYNCIEILHADHKLICRFNGWGIKSINIKIKNENKTNNYSITAEMIKTHLKTELEVVNYECEECCLINPSAYDLVDFGCKTQQGRRLLSQWLRGPLVSHEEIETRLGLTEAFANIEIKFDDLSDIKRLTAKIINNRITVRELSRLHQIVSKLPELCAIFNNYVKEYKSESISSQFLKPLVKCNELLQPMNRLIEDSINVEQAVIRNECSPALDLFEKERIRLLERIDVELAAVQRDFPNAKYFNKAFKLPCKAYSSRVFEEKRFVVLSLLKTGVTFITKGMSQLRNELDQLDSRINCEILAILSQLRSKLAQYTNPLDIYNHVIAMSDIFKAFSVKTLLSGYSRPSFNQNILKIESFFHPFLEGTECVLNSIEMSKQTGSICILTGPNMGGKSTLLKAISMVALYAQIGSYVPAKHALLPIFDRVFLRIGAQDCLSKGLSTFMVEMLEITKIIKTATSNSLILIDELGRGTSAADGYSLALSIRDYLAELGVLSFIATHYSGLGRDGNELNTKKCINKRMGIEKSVLTYKMEDGLCDTSFGLTIAELAGFPDEVLENAKKYLKNTRNE